MEFTAREVMKKNNNTNKRMQTSIKFVVFDSCVLFQIFWALHSIDTSYFALNILKHATYRCSRSPFIAQTREMVHIYHNVCEVCFNVMTNIIYVSDRFNRADVMVYKMGHGT